MNRYGVHPDRFIYRWVEEVKLGWTDFQSISLSSWSSWWWWWSSWQVHRWAEEVKLGWAEPLWLRPRSSTIARWKYFHHSTILHLLPPVASTRSRCCQRRRKFQQFKLISNRLHNYARSDQCPAGHSNVSMLSQFGCEWQSSETRKQKKLWKQFERRATTTSFSEWGHHLVLMIMVRKQRDVGRDIGRSVMCCHLIYDGGRIVMKPE